MRSRYCCIHALLVLLAGCSPALTGETSSLPDVAKKITPETAMAVAVNGITPQPNGYSIANPRFVAKLSPEGFSFSPKGSDLHWNWELERVGGSKNAAAGVPLAGIAPVQSKPGVFTYERGDLLEEYILRPQTIEQQFIIRKPLQPAGSDLVIRGRVHTNGVAEREGSEWVWRLGHRKVSFGEVKVFDSIGKILPAAVSVTGDLVSIALSANDLAAAHYPVTIDPEIGTNDFRISDMGPDGSNLYFPFAPAVAYNSVDNEYLVVWSSDDNTGSLINDEYEIYGQRIDAVTGAEVGTNDFRISDAGPDGNAAFDASGYDVAFDPVRDRYLVVFHADDNAGGLVDNEFEIYGQFIDGATGAETGTNDFRISDMGPDGDAAYSAFGPKVKYNATSQEFLVIWTADDNTGSLLDNETEVFGQRIDAVTGAEAGTNDFRITNMGPDGDANYDVLTTAGLEWNSTDNQYLVTYAGDDNTGALVDGEFEIYVQRLDVSGNLIGTHDQRISDVGTDGVTTFSAFVPQVAYNSVNNEYLVVWHGDDEDDAIDDWDIWGQRLDATGAEIGANDFRISSSGPAGDANYNGYDPRVIYNSWANEYFVVWYADDDTGGLVSFEFEAFGQRIDGATGAEIGTNDLRISDVGPDGDTNYSVGGVNVEYNSTNDQYLTLWVSNNDTAGLHQFENEIWGQLLDETATVGAPDLAASSDTGSSDTDDFTSDTTPAITGTAEPLSDVVLTSDVDGVIGSGAAGSDGIFTITVIQLNEGEHEITAVATDQEGNVSAQSAALTISIAPPLTISGIYNRRNGGRYSVRWTTNLPSTSLVRYRTGGYHGRPGSSAELTTSHAIRMPNLRNNRRYSYWIWSTDEFGRTAQAGPFFFRPLAARSN